MVALVAFKKRLGIHFETVAKEFSDRDAAMDWMDANQLGRRNITPDQFTLLLGRRYNRAKKVQGGTGANQHVQNGQIVQSANTAKKLADEHGVDERTVRRAGQHAEAIATVEKAIPGYSQAAAALGLVRFQIRPSRVDRPN